MTYTEAHDVPSSEDEVWCAYRRCCRWCVRTAVNSLAVFVYLLATHSPDLAAALGVVEGLALPWVWTRFRRARDINLAEVRQRADVS